MDFFQHQDRARSKSLLLIVYFGLAVAMVILSVYVVAIGLLSYAESRQNEHFTFSLWHPVLFGCVSVSVLAVIFTGSLYKIFQVGSSGDVVATSLGGRLVPTNSQNLSERILLNVVEEMALAAGTPVPPVYVLDKEEGINAFAAGTTPQNAVIGVTSGTLRTMKRDELQGVIAHEFSHILNGDMRLNLRLLGWLHGILVLAIIGWTILRILGNTGSSKRNSKENGGIFFILAIGGALVVIGYTGVFFARLIKSAISRQREFLADASAVQFTRNPLGISSALKKIGGWAATSQIASPKAEEISHMFFGKSSMVSYFATHPPLVQRIQRIEPTFDGSFDDTIPIIHSMSEIIDSHSLSQTHSSLTQSHAAAEAGADNLSQSPSDLSASIGEPRTDHIAHVHGLVDHLDAKLGNDLRDPLGTIAIIYGLLLAPPSSPVREGQLDILANAPDQRPILELTRVLKAIDELAAEQKLPVVSMALPTLKQLSPPQLQDFYMTAKKLMLIDRSTSLFEYAVHRFISKRLLSRLKDEQAPSGNLGWNALRLPFVSVLSTLAYAAGENQSQQAYQTGLEKIGGKVEAWPMLDQQACSYAKLDEALDQLGLASSKIKKQMIDSFTTCVTADRHTTIEEAELLRVIADALGCPVPPILEG